MMKLIGEDGSLNFGFSETPVGRVNYQDFPLRDRFRRPLPVTERERQFIHFHFLGFNSSPDAPSPWPISSQRFSFISLTGRPAT